jgi:YggT family protein
MFVLGNLCQAVAFILGKLLWIYGIIVMVGVLISWVSPDPFHPVVQFLRAMTEPVFAWVRRRLPFAVIGMVDLSPLVVLLIIQLLQMVVVRSLFDFAYRLR